MRVLKYILLFTLFSLSVTFAQVGPVSDKAKLAVDSEKFDFGKVKANTKIEHTFKISNIGTDTLKIYKVKSSWGCTAVLLSSEAILPGKSALIKATVETGNHKGERTKTVSIYTNDKKNRKKRLFIIFDVVSSAEKK